MNDTNEIRKQIRLDIAKEQSRKKEAIKNNDTSEKIRAAVSIFGLELKLSELFK